MADMDRYAVFGNPIAHSRSPQIHTLFARQTGQAIQYTAELVEIGQFGKAANNFFDNNGKGMNITVPFKEDAWQFADTHSKRALRAGAVNTLALQNNGKIFGDTTDGTGLVRDLINNHAITVQNKKILLLGAGGAVRGVLEPLLEQQPEQLLIANRTKQKAIALMSDFADLGNIQGCGLDEINQQQFDIVINGTSASLQGDLPPLPDNLFTPGACCYDMMYAAMPTPFMEWSQQHGAAQILDGLGMLVEQAAESFFIWRNVMPETQSVISTIRQSLTQPE